jgi:LSD1 subclass zinc finger protein
VRCIVEFCISNYETGSESVRDALCQTEDVELIEHGCMNFCGQCYLEPYALVNGVNFNSTSADELMEKIRLKLEWR